MVKNASRFISVVLSITIFINCGFFVTPITVAVDDEEDINNEQIIEPNNDETPSNDEETPSNDEETPSNDEETPSNDEETPSNDDETPSNDDETPSNDDETPSNDDVTPSNDDETPSNDDETPSKDEKESEDKENKKDDSDTEEKKGDDVELSPAKNRSSGTSRIISTVDELVTFINNYAKNAPTYSETDLTLFLTGAGGVWDITAATGKLGTADYPYKGTISFQDSPYRTFITKEPLFDYIHPDAVIDAGITIRRQLELNASKTPLFAAHVVKARTTSGTNTWDITVEPYNSIDNAFAGLIGEIGTDSEADVSFTLAYSSSAIVTSDDNIGLLCNTLGSNATLKVSGFTAGQGATVSSTVGHAGGIIGEMSSGSKLIWGGDITSPVSSVTTTGSGKNAGGIVGNATDATITTSGTITANTTVSSLSNAGGVFGNYCATKDKAFDFSKINITSSIIGGANSGGVFGMLSGSGANINISGNGKASSVSTVSFGANAGANRGGLVGAYSNTDLTKSFAIHDIYVTIQANEYSTPNDTAIKTSGGIIGNITSTSSASYVNVKDTTASTNAHIGGGIIGDMGACGSFLDLTGEVKVSSASASVLGGIVYKMNAGVLRLAGETIIDAATVEDTNHAFGTTFKNGQLVAERDKGLVYAVGDGKNNAWTFKRSNKNRRGDIGDWGEVVRPGAFGSDDSSSANYKGVLTYGTAHTVTVGAAVTSSIDDIDDVYKFAKTALNIQHNDSQPAASALKFAAGSANSGTLLGRDSASNLTISADINLGDTGLIGFTRDDGSQIFNGTLTVTNKATITLAIGEGYGVDSTGAAISMLNYTENTGNGEIFDHGYIGLFGITKNTSITNAHIVGEINTVTRSSSSTCDIGGIAGEAQGTLALTGVVVEETLNVGTTAKESKVNAGGAIGRAETASEITSNGCNFSPKVNDKNISNAADNFYAGGAVGKSSDNGATFNFNENNGTPTTVGAEYRNTTARAAVHFGGLIGKTTTSTVNINKVQIKDFIIIASLIADNAPVGGALGFDWNSTTVNVYDLELGDSSVDTIIPSVTVTSKKGNLGGLVYCAGGKWTVNKVKVYHASYTTPDGGEFGFLMNRANSGTSFAYVIVHLDGVQDEYDLRELSLTGTPSVYDEIVAHTHADKQTVVDNGSAVVTIEYGAPENFKMSDGSWKTYQNQQNYTPKGNLNSRYYYNIESFRTSAEKTDAQKLMLWSLNKYADSSIRTFFANPFTGDAITAGTYDMDGYSYYPINIYGPATVSIDDAMFVFYNQEIEDDETGTENTDNFSRTTRASASQHYLMHTGIFNIFRADFAEATPGARTATLNVNNVIFKGTAGAVSGVSGMLIRNSLGGYKDKTTLNIDGITLDGARIVGDSDVLGALLVETVGGNTDVRVNDVKTVDTDSKYSTMSKYAADSLFGAVGSAAAEGITLSFSKIKLDSRKKAIGDTEIDNSLYAAYQTSRAIFSDATLLRSFQFKDDISYGSYNYTQAEDGSNHNVTYGFEISGSDEFNTTTTTALDYQRHYSGGTVYTNPNNATPDSPYDFSSDTFLRYVNAAYNTSTKNHELKINHKVAEVGSGCGTWYHPYVINGDGQLETFASIINGTAASLPGSGILLPKDLGTNDSNAFTLPTGPSEGNTHHDYFNISGGNFVNSDLSITIPYKRVSQYLAGAYYKITSNITIGESFIGISAESASHDGASEYSSVAFRGVIYGVDDTITITNTSTAPLIISANGAVIKDVNIIVDSETAINRQFNTADAKFVYNTGGIPSYGAVISKVMGGDNFIDGVNVTFPENTKFTFNTSGNAYTRCIPVGGYVGVAVTGTLVFRNISGATGLQQSNCYKNDGTTALDYDTYLYVNPIIGRVLVASVFSEGCSVDNSYQKNGARTIKDFDIPRLYKTYDGTAESTPASISVESEGTAVKMLSVASDGKTITIPNGQAFWVLSTIVNSGAGAWESNAYNILEQNTAWQGWRRYCAYRDNTTDYNNCTLATDTRSTFAGSNNTPYIISAYVSAENRDKMKSIATPNVESAIVISGDCTIPSGYRGIGNIYHQYNGNANQSKYYHKLNLKSVNGNNYSIVVNILYQEYDQILKNTGMQASGMMNTNGLGLFNILRQDVTISNLKISGRVEYNKYRRDNGNQIEATYGTGSSDQSGLLNQPKRILNIGLLAGSADMNVILNNVTIDGNSYLFGYRYAGGLIGDIANSKTIKMTDCGIAEGCTVYVQANCAAGGLVGHIESNFSDANTNYYANSIKGSKLSGSTSNNGSFNEFTNITVRNVVVNRRTTISASSNDYSFGGGVIGQAENAGIKMQNVPVKDPDIKAYCSGGVIGRLNGRGVLSAVNVTVKSTITDSEDEPVKGNISAELASGGIVGKLYQNNGLFFGYFDRIDVENEIIKSYKIVDDDKENKAAGGVIGGYERASANVAMIIIQNTKVSKCIIESKYNTEKSRNGVGGLVGSSSRGNYNANCTINGYNIFVSKVELSQKNNSGSVKTFSGRGSLIGDNAYGNAASYAYDDSIKLVGVSVCDTTINGVTAARAIGKKGESTNTTTEFNDTGYIVYADYYGLNMGNETFPTLGNYTNNVMVEGPYVTVNPKTDITEEIFLTGDGVLEDCDSDTRENILRDAIGKYAIYSSAVLDYVANYGTKLSTYKNAHNLPSLPDGMSDFPVLVLDDLSREKPTEMINGYIQGMTNTAFNYADNSTNSDKFTVTLYRYKINAGSIVPDSPGSSNVKWDTTLKHFFMSANSTDSEDYGFTIMDIAFCNPYNTSEIAFHLYVPIVVLKIMEVEVNIGVLNGTNYLPSAYLSRLGSPVIENIGAPVSIYAKFAYHRTSEEWQNAINAGENLLTAYTKVLTFEDNLPQGAKITLIDNTTRTPYYYTVETSTEDSLDFSGFRDLSNNSFKPKYFCELLNLTVTPDNEDGLYVETIESDSNKTIKVGETYYRLWTDEDGEVDRFNVTVNNSDESCSIDNESITGVKMWEDFFLTIDTDPVGETDPNDPENQSDNMFYNYTLGATFDGPTWKTVISSTAEKYQPHIILGDIIDQSEVTFSTCIDGENYEDVQLISDQYKIIKATLRTTISLKGTADNKITVATALENNDIEVFHSLLLELNVKAANNAMPIKAIYVDPDTTGSGYTLDGAVPIENYESTRIKPTYLEFVSGDIKDSLKNSSTGYQAILSSTVYLIYDSVADRETQFPLREDLADTNVGVTFTGRSNVAFIEDGTAASAEYEIISDASQHVYHREGVSKSAKLYYNVEPDIEGDYQELGLNPIDHDPSNEFNVSTKASYDVSAISADTVGYGYVKVILTLWQKDWDNVNNDHYDQIEKLSDYISSITIENRINNVGDNSLNGSSYTFYLPRNSIKHLNNPDDLRFEIDYVIKSNFDDGRVFANYRIELTAFMQKSIEDFSDYNTLGRSQASDFIIYTNARLLTEYIVDSNNG